MLALAWQQHTCRREPERESPSGKGAGRPLARALQYPEDDWGSAQAKLDANARLRSSKRLQNQLRRLLSSIALRSLLLLRCRLFSVLQLTLPHASGSPSMTAAAPFAAGHTDSALCLQLLPGGLLASGGEVRGWRPARLQAACTSRTDPAAAAVAACPSALPPPLSPLLSSAGRRRLPDRPVHAQAGRQDRRLLLRRRRALAVRPPF